LNDELKTSSLPCRVIKEEKIKIKTKNVHTVINDKIKYDVKSNENSSLPEIKKMKKKKKIENSEKSMIH
jgi:hypothetical protein